MAPRGAIDDDAARGLRDDEADDKAKGWQALFECKPLLVLAACLGLFHLGNGAMLPLYGLAVVAAHKGEPASTVALTIVVAQAVMVVASIFAMRMAEARGHWLVLLINFIALPIRSLVAAAIITGWGVYPVQILDGAGASLSPAIGGAIAQAGGYRITFVILGAFALGSLGLWLGFRSLLRPACDHDAGAGAGMSPA